MSDDPDGAARSRPRGARNRPARRAQAPWLQLTKARTIVETARAIVAGDLDLEGLEHVDDRAAIERLKSLRGVGRWTAEYVMLRGLGRLHIFPGDDVGAHNKLRRFFDIDSALDYDSVKRLVAPWHPYAGVVYFHLLLDSLSEADVVASA